MSPWRAAYRGTMLITRQIHESYGTQLKGSIFLKNIYCIIQERFKKYSYNHKMWYLAAYKISVSLLFLNWSKNEMMFYRISELMLPTLLQGYKKII